jgi:histone demethylase JARID1
MQHTISLSFIISLYKTDESYIIYRTRQTVEAKYKLTVEELTLFFEQIESLPCTIKEGGGVKELLDKVTEFQKESAVLLSQEMPESQLLDKCLESGVILDIELPEIPKLKQVICTG